MLSTFFQDAIIRPGAKLGVLFPTPSGQFLVRDPFDAANNPISNGMSQIAQTSLPNDRYDFQEDFLVRLPRLRESEWKVKVLQQWVGLVEQVDNDRFLAVIEDTTNSTNPPEQVELDTSEVSDADLPLLAEGATFYWSIGYRVTPGGQRERISTLRFARYPRLAKADMDRILAQADALAAYLESD